MSSSCIASFLDRAELALANNRTRREAETCFLQHIIGGVVELSTQALSPAALFRAARQHATFAQHARDQFMIVGVPLQRPNDSLRAGDLMIRAVPETGDVGHVSLLAADDLIALSSLVKDGVSPEGTQPGYYGIVIEPGVFPHTRAQRFVRRFLDSRGRVPPYTVILRRRDRITKLTLFPPEKPESLSDADGASELQESHHVPTQSSISEDIPQDPASCKQNWQKFLDSFPADVIEALKNQGPELAVVLAIHHGERDLEKLTTLFFDAKYGEERGYCPVAGSDTYYQLATNLQRRVVRSYLARPRLRQAQHGGAACQKVERTLETARPDAASVNITGRYEHRYPDSEDPKWTVTEYTFNINQAGKHIEGYVTNVLRPEDKPEDRLSTRFHGDLQSDGSFLVYSIARPDQLWGYLTYEQKGTTWHLYWQRMANDDNKPLGAKLKLVKVSDYPTLMEWAFSDQAFPIKGAIHLHERWPLTQGQITHLVTGLAEDKIASLLQTYFTTPVDDRAAQRNALIDAAKPFHRHIESVFTDKHLGIHLFDVDLSRYYAKNILSQNKWTFKGITRSQLDWIQIMLDVVSGFGFDLPAVKLYIGLKPTVGPGQTSVDSAAKLHKYKVSYSLHGFLVYYRGTITVEETSGTTPWKQTFKIALKGFQSKPGFSITEEGEAETSYEWTERDVPGSVELVTGKLGGRIPGLKATAGAWFMHIFGSEYLPYMDVLGTEVKTKISLDKKFKLDLVNLGGLWGEIYANSLPDKDYSKFVPATDYIAGYNLYDDIHFCLGSALLTEDARQALRIVCANELAAFISPDSALRIVGHADRVDTEARNYELSEMRAKNTLQAMKDILGSSFHILDDHIVLLGKGEEEAAKAQPSGEKPDPRFRRVDVFLNSRLVISLKAG